MKKFYLIILFLLSLLCFNSGCKTYNVGIVEHKQLLTPNSSNHLYFYYIKVKDKKEPIQTFSDESVNVGDTVYILNRGKR